MTRFADGLEHPRNMIRLPNGDILVTETNAQKRSGGGGSVRDWVMGKLMAKAGAGVPSPDRIRLLRDTDGDGRADQRYTLLAHLALRNGAGRRHAPRRQHDSLMAYPYKAGDTVITAPGRKVAALPAGGPNYHWTKSLVASPDGSRLYVGVGSNSNIAENGLDAERGRALILEIDPATGASHVLASGLRNPTGLAFSPKTGTLWAVVNERDMLGSDLVPDYLTEVRSAGFYGWPWAYWGGHEDKRVQPQRPDLVKQTVRPDFGLGVHVAALGIAFAQGATLGAPFDDGMFVALHGSWNREPPAGYKVAFVRFDADGRPQGKLVDVLSGFLNKDGEAQGRPVAVVVDANGSLLVSDDVGGVIWRITNPASKAVLGKPAP